jgi:hypothetical protein
MAVRLAALALAICSRSAADDLRLEPGDVSAESVAREVVLEEMDGILPSHALLVDWVELEDTFLETSEPL